MSNTPSIERAPGYIPEAQLLLGTRAFYDDERQKQLHEGKLYFTPESAGMRGLLYVRTLRLMAEASQEGRFDFNAPDARLQLGKFALEHLPQAGDIARQLAVINTAEHMLAEREKAFFAGLREHQKPYMHDIVKFMNTVPQQVVYSPEPDVYATTTLRGALVEAPTGLGKTVLMARALVAAGVGRPIEAIEHDQKPVRALLIVPSQTIVEQLTGKVGDDTLRRFAPGIHVGGFYQHERDHTADAVVITIDKFIEDFRNGMLHGETFDICIIDEAHRATQPRFQKTLIEHWGDKPVIGFTATPEYHRTKDARLFLPHRIFHGDILDYTQNTDDVLNAAQLFEIRVDHDKYLGERIMDDVEGLSPQSIDQLVIREATADFLEPMIKEGRRGIIFCEQGGGEPSGYAIKMAERLSTIKKPDGSYVNCAVAGTINNGKNPRNPNSNQGIRRRYATGEIDFIVTVDWGREGLNEDVDIVITAGNVTSQVKFLQEIGRGTRLSSRFPVTVYGHLFVPTMKRNALSLFGLFGFETIEQGVVLGAQRRKPRRAKNSGSDRSMGRLFDFPPIIVDLIKSIEAKSVGEALFHPESTLALPKDFLKFEDIMRDVPGPPITIRKYLRDTLGFRSIGRYEPSDNGRDFVFYFEPDTKKHLDKYRGAVARVELQRELGGIDVTIVDEMADKVKATPFDWFYKDGKFIVHYSLEHSNLIRAEHHKTPDADPTDYNRPRLAAMLGISNSALASRLLPEEWLLAKPKRTKTKTGKIRILDHWESLDAARIIARFDEQNEINSGPAYLVPYDLAARYVNIDKARLIKFADDYGEPTEIVRIARSGRPPRCVTWEVMQAAQDEYGVRNINTDALDPRHLSLGVTSLTIDYSRLPNGRNDKDQSKALYAAEVVAMLRALPSKKLTS